MDRILLEKVAKDMIAPYKKEVLTGFEDLDEMLATAEKGSVIVVGGRPAMGKSAFMSSVLENLLKLDKNCFYYYLQGSKEEFIRRMLLLKTETNSVLFRLNKISASEWEEKTVDAINFFEKAKLEVADSSMLELPELFEKVKESGAEYLFIDYLQLIKINYKKSVVEELEKVLVELKSFAKANGVTVFISSQLSRAVENRMDKRPMLSDLRSSGAIENLADVVMFIYRDEYYSRELDNEYRKNCAEVIIAKNKLGPVGIIELKFVRGLAKFQSMGCSNVF